MSEQTFEQKCHAGDHPRIPVTAEFVERNRLSLNRTPAEIIAKMNDPKSDPLGFSSGVLADYLTFDQAEGIRSKEIAADAWGHVVMDVMEATQDFLDYMVFGWDKATGERGISASRTIVKIAAWLWLLGREDLAFEVGRDDLYNPYGAPALIKVCEAMGIEVPPDLREFAKELATW